MIPILLSADFDLDSLLDRNSNNLIDRAGLQLNIRNASASIPSHNGIGLLADAVECFTDSELNGGYELVLQYPADGIHADGLVNRNIIMAVNEKDGNAQPYRIYRITKPLGGMITVYARHIVQTDLAGIPVAPFTASNVTSAIQNLNNRAMIATGFSFSTNKGTAANMSITKPTPLLSVLGGTEGSILDTYGGEYRYNGKSVALRDHIGTDRGVRIAYGVNLTSFEQDTNIQDCYTGAVGYWSNDDVTVYTNVLTADGAFDHVRIATIDLTDKFQNKPSKASLESALRSYMAANGIGVPKVSINLSFVDLSQTTEYADIVQSVALGDTVHVGFAKIGVDASARVVKTRWNVLLDRYDNIDIGSVKSNIADTIAKQTRQIADAPNRKTTATIASAMAQAIMGAAGGAVRIVDTDDDGMPDELYIADNPNPEQATKVWRFNYEGWAASTNGYAGPFNVGATVDGGIMVGGEGNKLGRIQVFGVDGELCGVFNNAGITMMGNTSYPTTKKLRASMNGRGFAVLGDSNEDGVRISIAEIMSAESADGGTESHASFGYEKNNTGVETVYIDGKTGRIDCRELYVNGHPVLTYTEA